MKKNINVFSDYKLPNGFKYPDKYLSAVEKEQDLSPWIFVDAKSDVGKLLYTIGMSNDNKLIPFASLENGDGDAASFDGTDLSGDPKVIMLILDGSERKYEYKNFSDWLNKAND